MNRIPVLSLAVLLAASPAAALEWLPLGARSVGMGGVGVAVPQGPVSSYWNPATIGSQDSASGFQVPFSAHYGITGSVIEGANDLNELRDAGASATDAEIQAALAKLNQPGNGVRVDGGLGFDFKVGRLAVFGNGFTQLGAVPRVDTANNTAGTLGGNTSELILKGGGIAEFGVGHGRELPFAPGLFAGANLKLVQAQVGYASLRVVSEDADMDDLMDKLEDSYRRSTNFGVDAGLLWDVERTIEAAPFRPRVGLTGRNLNNPKFKQPAAGTAAGQGDLRLNPQLRLGAAFSPVNWWHVGADLDMTENTTMVDNVNSRHFGVGTEVNLVNSSKFNLPLRAGLQRNLAEKGAGTMLTLGTGIQFLYFNADASVGWSPKKIRTDSRGETTDVPRELTVGLSVGLQFGGRREDEPARPSSSGSSSSAESLDVQSTEKVRQNMEKAQQGLDKEAAKPRLF